VNYLGKREIEENIRKECYSNRINVNVKTIMHDDITFVYIKERQKKKRIQRVMPIFFALFLGHKHFFCSKKNVPLDFVKAITVVLGHIDSKRIKLMGRDLRSLIRLLWIKQQGVLCVENITRSPVYKPSEPIVT